MIRDTLTYPRIRSSRTGITEKERAYFNVSIDKETWAIVVFVQRG